MWPGGSWSVSWSTNESVKPAAEATWSIGTSLMTSIATTVIVVGVLFSVAGWLGSPTGSARASRRAIAPALRDYGPYVYTGLAIIVSIYFLSAPTQNLRSFLTTLIVAGDGRVRHPRAGQTDRGGVPGRRLRRDLRPHPGRVVDAVKSANLGERAPNCGCPEMRDAEGGETPTSEAPTAVVAPSEDDARLGRLERLAGLHEKGVLTDEEFAAEKSRVLGNGDS